MNYHLIKKDDMLNGDGIRVTIFLSGCSHHCPNCQNPETWDINSGKKFDKSAKKELYDILNKPYIAGITFSGGDPLNDNNLHDLLKLIQSIKESAPSKTIWLYTGYTWEEIMHPIDKLGHLRQQVVANCDVLVDGRYVEALRDVNYPWAGSTNQRIIDVKISLENNMAIKYGDR